MYYNLARTPQQKDFQTREFINATADIIDELSFTTEAELHALRKENEEQRIRIERLEEQLQTRTKPNMITADIRLSEESLDKAQADLVKALQKGFSR